MALTIACFCCLRTQGRRRHLGAAFHLRVHSNVEDWNAHCLSDFESENAILTLHVKGAPACHWRSVSDFAAEILARRTKRLHQKDRQIVDYYVLDVEDGV